MNSYDVGYNHGYEDRLPLSEEECRELFLDFDDYMSGYTDGSNDC